MRYHDRLEEKRKWEMSDRYKGYACCPVCKDTYVEPEWIVNLKWRYCPTCGERLEPPEVEDGNKNEH